MASSKYDKQIAISREQEGSYHRRETSECAPSATKTTTSYRTERRLVPSGAPFSATPKLRDTSDSDSDNFEEWTTSKRKVNHTTRQVETRVSRQLLVEDGKVIADSGPQVTTRIKEDNKVEECEKEKAPKSKRGFEALEAATSSESPSSSGRVLGEKKEIQRVSREVREENMQYHDERLKELTGRDVHRRAIKAPHELMNINEEHASSGAPRGKMVHYSNKGKKFQDTDEILEVAKLAIDGSITKEVKHTRHHEEFSDDEKPDKKGEAEALRAKPIVERSSRRHVDYVNDFNDFATPPHSSDDDERASSRRVSSSARRRASQEAFPRYEIDPLLNSLRDEDFKPPNQRHHHNHHNESTQARSIGHVREHSPMLVDSAPRGGRQRARSSSRSSTSSASSWVGGAHQRAHHEQQQQPSGVQIPEEYRVNKQRLMSSKSPASSLRGQSPNLRQVHKQQQQQQQEWRRRPQHSQARRAEDASVQARLTDEEQEELNAHEKTARYLERQSTPNSSRHYYYGEPKKERGHSRRRHSSSSSSSSSSSELHTKRVESRDSGFRSPAQRAQTPSSNIYSVSSKSRRARKLDAASPTPSTGSRRSVKTTTTTLAAGLKERPLSPEHLEASQSDDERPQRPERAQRNSGNSPRRPHKSQQQQQQQGKGAKFQSDSERGAAAAMSAPTVARQQQQQQSADYKRRQRKNSLDSVSSLRGPNATKIKVPYRPAEGKVAAAAAAGKQRERGGKEDEEEDDEMNLRDDIESLSRRLELIRRGNASAQCSEAREHFHYKPLVANVQRAGKQNTTNIGVYNVQLGDQQSAPFVANLELAALQMVGGGVGKATSDAQQSDSGLETTTSNGNCAEASMARNGQENNNDAAFDLSQFNFKYRAEPALVEPNVLLDRDEQEERMSDASSCSLHSSKTYNVRKLSEEIEAQLRGGGGAAAARNRLPEVAQTRAAVEPLLDEQQVEEALGVEQLEQRKNPAWIFDPRDNSSTAIAPPPKPKGPVMPEVLTEELASARGGRSYYLELIDKKAKAELEQEEEQEDDEADGDEQRHQARARLYARWNSQGALSGGARNDSCWLPDTKAKQTVLKVSNKATRTHLGAKSALPTQTHSTSKINSLLGNRLNTITVRRQLPYGGAPLQSSNNSSIANGNRSKSSSCLLSVTKPSKYSIYGGFRKPGETSKPVPRLSYSRAIGPRSQRQLDAQPKMPSRYLKMK